MIAKKIRREIAKWWLQSADYQEAFSTEWLWATANKNIVKGLWSTEY